MNMTISYSRLRDNLKSTCDQVCEEHEPVLVKRQNGDNVVLVAEEDYSSLIETAYLMRSPTNAKRLLENEFELFVWNRKPDKLKPWTERRANIK